MDEELKTYLEQMDKRIAERIQNAETRMLRFVGMVPIEPTSSDKEFVAELHRQAMAEFWQGLGRLYDSSVELRAASEALLKTAQAHEGRLDKIEVVQEWLADAERRREKEKGQ